MKKKLVKYIAVCCATAALLTVIILSAVSNSAKRIVSSRESVPDYIRYMDEGYSFDAYSNIYNLLMCIVDGKEVSRVHIFSIDKDKRTLSILDIPPSSYIFSDGFEGIVSQAYSTSVFKSIIGRCLMLDIDGYVEISSEGFESACKLIDLRIKGDLISDSSVYLGKDVTPLKSYYGILSDFAMTLCDLGAVEASSKLIGILINEIATDLDISSIMKLMSFCGKISIDDSSIYLLPGRAYELYSKNIYAPDPEKVQRILDESFRVYGKTVDAEDLGFTVLTEGDIAFGGLSHRLQDY